MIFGKKWLTKINITHNIYNIVEKIIILNITKKTVIGRVDIECSHSELAMVRGQHEVYIEEHPGVVNRNPFGE